MDEDSSSSSTPPLPPKSPTRRRITSGEHQPSSEERRLPGGKHTKRRSKDGITGSIKDLARLLGYQEREINDLQQMLYSITEQLKNEKQRADDADRKAWMLRTGLGLLTMRGFLLSRMSRGPTR
jgi:hypothetical protein